MKAERETQDVWNEFSGQIQNYLKKKVKLQDDADDLLQDIFIKIHGNINQLENQQKLAPWIYRIVHNSLTDYYRKNIIETSELDEESTASSDEAAEDDVYSACVSGCLRVFIDRLPEKYREPLILSDFQGLKQKDIAKEMSLSYSGLKSRVQRGREMIKDMFVECTCYTIYSQGHRVPSSFDSENCEICNPEPISDS